MACIGCARCQKECPFDAITVENNLAYIDFKKCKLCRKCVAVCPTGAIWEVNFPPRVVKSEPKTPAAAPATTPTATASAPTEPLKTESNTASQTAEASAPVVEQNEKNA